MGIFSRRKINNVAASSLPDPTPVNQTVHHHGTNWPLIIWSAVPAVALLLIILWLFLVHLFGELGYRHPGREAAFWVLAIPLFAIATWLLGQLAVAVGDSIIAGVHAIVIDVQKEITERKRLELAATQSLLDPGRMNEGDYQFAQVVLAVMNEAYNFLEKNKATAFKNRWRPWSINSTLDAAKALEITLTQAKAGQVVKWLRANDVVTGDGDGQINMDAYPDKGAVRALLDNKFGKPIVINKFPPLRDNQGYMPIGE